MLLRILFLVQLSPTLFSYSHSFSIVLIGTLICLQQLEALLVSPCVAFLINSYLLQVKLYLGSIIKA
jgi:hypothetical protein